MFVCAHTFGAFALLIFAHFVCQSNYKTPQASQIYQQFGYFTLLSTVAICKRSWIHTHTYIFICNACIWMSHLHISASPDLNLQTTFPVVVACSTRSAFFVKSTHTNRWDKGTHI